MIWTLAQVAAGGALGASGRFFVARGAARLFGPETVIGTLMVNVAGSVAIGALVVVFAHFGGHRHATFLVTGMLGAFTTFSTFSLDTARLVESGATGTAAVYVAANVAFSLAGVALGLRMTRWLLA